jgi:hypothetical protein
VLSVDLSIELVELSVNGNMLTTLPSAIGHCSSLEILEVRAIACSCLVTGMAVVVELSPCMTVEEQSNQEAASRAGQVEQTGGASSQRQRDLQVSSNHRRMQTIAGKSDSGSGLLDYSERRRTILIRSTDTAGAGRKLVQAGTIARGDTPHHVANRTQPGAQQPRGPATINWAHDATGTCPSH